jgi:hypothetical protein
MKFEIHFHIEFILRSDQDWAKSSPKSPVNRCGQITIDNEAVQSEVDAVKLLNEIYENDADGTLVSLDGIDPANVMMKLLIVDEIIPH